MALTVSLYNHTAKLFADGSNAVGDTYKVALYTAATFDATDTTLAGITKTETAGANGYTTGGQALANVAIEIPSSISFPSGAIVYTDDADFIADNVTWSASGGSISAAYAILYNDTDANDPPLAFIDFDGTQTAVDGADLSIRWATFRLFKFTVG